ncbi:YbaY family lipoprotein [Psychromonas sp. KJ10-10]|uniref:YbaY family lipoprotein n=1 Tax=Psychromonas sp. KJ10-10 TaxID=3391823 RepID=UPI0039B4D866
MQHKRTFYLFLTMMSAIFLNGCDDQAMMKDEAISLLQTEVVYYDSMVLPEGAMLEVSLHDTTKVDAPFMVSHASRTIKNSPPFLIQLAIPHHVIKIDHHYDLQALIKVDGEVYFNSRSVVNPFEFGVVSPITLSVELLRHEHD